LIGSVVPRRNRADDRITSPQRRPRHRRPDELWGRRRPGPVREPLDCVEPRPDLSSLGGAVAFLLALTAG
jgi:hypothetical protein